MTTFDAAIPRLIGACMATPELALGDHRICVLRDLRGRIRIALELGLSLVLDVDDLQKRLQTSMGGYFVGPILVSRGAPETTRLVRDIFSTSEPWPDGWPTEPEKSFAGQSQSIDRARWRAVRRVLSKHAWLERRTDTKPLWALVPTAKTPPPVVVSFYSYKGGVGRTTLLALVARALAKQGKRVVVIDLDLEAPGAAMFLGASTPSGRGVIDFIVDHVVAETASIDGLYSRAAELKDGLDSRVDVFPAGTISAAYLEKLARLDFAATRTDGSEPSPSEKALRALITTVRSQLAPDYVLLDSRAGLHDLGGLSLHSLSHIDVLVSRSGPQALEGLRITAQSLARRRAPHDRRIVVVHSLVPSDKDLAERERAAFQDEAYRIFENSVYADALETEPAEGEELSEGAEMPSYDDDQAAHYAWPVKRYTELETASTIREVDDAFADTEEIRAIVNRLSALATAEES